jgi:hypothetical protein
MKKILLPAVTNSLGTVVYIAVVAWFMTFLTSSTNNLLANISEVLAATIMLTLLVLSVAVVGSLIFGRPLMWYLDGKKREAINLLVTTIGSLFVLLLIIVIVILTAQ